MDQMTTQRSVRQLCGLHPAALDFALADQIEHLSDLLDATERNASGFFSKNYVNRRDIFKQSRSAALAEWRELAA